LFTSVGAATALGREEGTTRISGQRIPMLNHMKKKASRRNVASRIQAKDFLFSEWSVVNGS
jgi:hypothetical protein